MPSHRPARRVLLAVVLSALVAVHAAADTPAGGWWSAASPHFTLFTDAGPEVARRAALDLEQLRAFLAEIAPSGRFTSAAPFDVHLFADHAAIDDFLPDAGLAAGFVVPGALGVHGAAVWAGDGPLAGRFLYKQYLLWVLHENLPELPAWFRQGLAEYYATFAVVDGEARVGLPIRENVEWLRRASGPAQLRLLEGGEARLANVSAWGLVHYLVLGNDETRSRVPGWVRRLAGGEDPEEAFVDVFGVSHEQMLERVRDYVTGDRFRFLRIPLASLPQPPVTVSAMSAADVEYRLGELLLSIDGAGDEEARRRAAEARFRKALALEPGHGGATGGIGRLAAARGDTAAALAAYEAAAPRRPDDFRLQYLLGDVLVASLDRRRPADGAERAVLDRGIAALRRATELQPGFGTAWERLGFALNLQPQASAEAVAALRRALEMAPDRTDTVHNLLLAHARLGDAEGVEAMTIRLETLGADEETLRRARETRLRLRLHEAEALARSDRLDDAVALFARVRAETSDPALAEAAGKQLELVARVEQRNRYAALYHRAAGLLDAGDPAAREVVEELRAMARPGLQTEAADALAERLPP